jgi:hypothetical protein
MKSRFYAAPALVPPPDPSAAQSGRRHQVVAGVATSPTAGASLAISPARTAVVGGQDRQDQRRNVAGDGPALLSFGTTVNMSLGLGPTHTDWAGAVRDIDAAALESQWGAGLKAGGAGLSSHDGTVGHLRNWQQTVQNSGGNSWGIDPVMRPALPGSGIPGALLVPPAPSQFPEVRRQGHYEVVAHAQAANAAAAQAQLKAEVSHVTNLLVYHARIKGEEAAELPPGPGNKWVMPHTRLPAKVDHLLGGEGAVSPSTAALALWPCAACDALAAGSARSGELGPGAPRPRCRRHGRRLLEFGPQPPPVSVAFLTRIRRVTLRTWQLRVRMVGNPLLHGLQFPPVLTVQEIAQRPPGSKPLPNPNRYRQPWDVVPGVDVFTSPYQYMRLPTPQDRSRYLQGLVPPLLWRSTSLFVAIPRPHGTTLRRQQYVWHRAVDEAHAEAQTKVLSKQHLALVAAVAASGGGVGYLPSPVRSSAAVRSRAADIPPWFDARKKAPPDAFVTQRAEAAAAAQQKLAQAVLAARSVPLSEAQAFDAQRRFGTHMGLGDSSRRRRLRVAFPIPRTVADVVKLPAGCNPGFLTATIPDPEGAASTVGLTGFSPGAGATASGALQTLSSGGPRAVTSPGLDPSWATATAPSTPYNPGAAWPTHTSGITSKGGGSAATGNDFGPDTSDVGAGGGGDVLSDLWTTTGGGAGSATYITGHQRGVRPDRKLPPPSSVPGATPGAWTSGPFPGLLCTDGDLGPGSTGVTTVMGPPLGNAGGGFPAPRAQAAQQLPVGHSLGLAAPPEWAVWRGSSDTQEGLEANGSGRSSHHGSSGVATSGQPPPAPPAVPEVSSFFRHMHDQCYGVPSPLGVHIERRRRFNKHASPVGPRRLAELLASDPSMGAGSPMANGHRDHQHEQEQSVSLMQSPGAGAGAGPTLAALSVDVSLRPRLSGAATPSPSRRPPASKPLGRTQSTSLLLGPAAGTSPDGPMGTMSVWGGSASAPDTTGFVASPLPLVLQHPLQREDALDPMHTMLGTRGRRGSQLSAGGSSLGSDHLGRRSASTVSLSSGMTLESATSSTLLRPMGTARTCVLVEGKEGQARSDYSDTLMAMAREAMKWMTSKPHVARDMLIIVSGVCACPGVALCQLTRPTVHVVRGRVLACVREYATMWLRAHSVVGRGYRRDGVHFPACVYTCACLQAMEAFLRTMASAHHARCDVTSCDVVDAVTRK